MLRHPENRCWAGKTAQWDSGFPRTIVVRRAEISRRSSKKNKKNKWWRTRDCVCYLWERVLSLMLDLCQQIHLRGTAHDVCVEGEGCNCDDRKHAQVLELFLPPSLTVYLTQCLCANTCPSLTSSSEQCATHSETIKTCTWIGLYKYEWYEYAKTRLLNNFGFSLLHK